MPDEGGHVSVVRGLLEKLACDAVVVPTDRRFQVEPSWSELWGGGPVEPLKPEGWGRGRSGPARGDECLWFLDVAVGAQESVGWLVEGVRDVLDGIAGRGVGAGTGRARPLVAMPTLGVEGGGYDAVRGEVIPALLDQTRRATQEHGYDVALVAKEESDFAAFQAVRRRERESWPLDDAALDQAQRLGNLARDGRLALFLGAGVSIPAGLPSWERLLRDLLGEDAGAARLEGLSALDQAEYVRVALGDQVLREGVRERFGGVGRHALGHALLAGLGCREIVTTNFDSLYELAYRSVSGDRALVVLPWGEPTPDRPWLLKMHGDVSDPASITLSRTDLVRFDAMRRPVGSVLQTLLMLRHVLFVGASMNDDNVLRVVAETAEFLARHDRSPEMGTVVTLRPDVLRSRLYEGRFHYVSTGTAEASDEDVARRAEVFLDAVATYASSTSAYLLDPRYAALLVNEGERHAVEVAQQLTAALDALDPSSRDEGWALVEAALRRVGSPRRIGSPRRLGSDERAASSPSP